MDDWDEYRIVCKLILQPIGIDIGFQFKSREHVLNNNTIIFDYDSIIMAIVINCEMFGHKNKIQL